MSSVSLACRAMSRTAHGTLTPEDPTYAHPLAQSPLCHQMHGRCGSSRQCKSKMACMSDFEDCRVTKCSTVYLQGGWVLDLAEAKPLDDPTGTQCWLSRRACG